MALELPTQLVECISRIKTISNRRVVQERVWLYVQSSPDYFNEFVKDNLVLLHARYGFNSNEHGDWVCPSLCYLGGIDGGEGNNLRALNSLILKSPVDEMPSMEEIKIQHEWCEEFSRASSDKTHTLLTTEELQEHYVARICSQFYDHTILLNAWRESGSPRDQQDCANTNDRKHIKSVLTAQRRNVLSAKELVQKFQKVFAPSFIVDRAKATQLLEQKVYEQLEEILRSCI